MSVQQSINQSILAAGALYSQSDAAEQKKGKLELQREKKGLNAANEKYDELKYKRYGKAKDELYDALEEYRMKKAENVMNIGLKTGNFKAYEVGRRNFKDSKNILEDDKRHEEFQYIEPDVDDDEYDEYDEMEAAAQKEKDRREKRVMMRQANRAAVQKRIEMLSDRDFRQDVFGGN